jgi:hypothetical protein
MIMADIERREVIYTDGGGRSGGSTAIVAVAVLAILVVLFLVFGRGLINGSDTKTIKADVDIHAPASGGSGK